MELVQTLGDQPHAFLEPQSSLHASALALAKQYLDPLAIQITERQQERQRHARQIRKRKRKRGVDGEEDEEEEEQLRMKQIYTDGFGMDQVWQQARKVLGAAADEMDRELPEVMAEAEGNEEDNDDSSIGEEGVDWEYEGDDIADNDDDDEEPDDLGDEVDLDGEGSSAEDEDLGEETPLSDLGEDEDDEEVEEEYVKDPNGLNDGFFSIDEFNKRSAFLENLDAKGDIDDGAASDEEEIDWTIDPLSAASQVRRKPGRDNADEVDDEDDEEGDEAGFGNADLDAPFSDDEDGDMEEADDGDMLGLGGDFSNTNDIQYAEFFAPPKVAQSSKKKAKSKTVQQKVKFAMDEEDGDNEGVDKETARAMSNVQRDLFDDDDSMVGSDEDMDGDVDPDDPRSRNLSSHERRQLALRAEIRRLEAENLEAKPWALMGESVAPARPQNGLLEEDLDFERSGKPVHIVTAAINESIEDLIKRRILNKEFDEVRRRRPDDLITGGDQARRGKIELSDQKSKKGLAEEYEEEYLRENDPNHVDSRSEELKAKHRAIEAQWASISGQLDSLSNWHYKPKPASAALDIRVDAPTIAMEDARPSAGGDVNGTSALAPQEVYRVGQEGKREGEVVSKGGTVAAREEETQEQRRRRRRRAKERAKKAGLNKPLAAASANAGADGEVGHKKEKKADVIKQLKKGGVKVIGKKGELEDVEGKAVKQGAPGGGASGGIYKL